MLAFFLRAFYPVGVVHRDKRPIVPNTKPVRFRGVELESEEIARIRAVVLDHSGASRHELTTLVCREFGWRRPNGELRRRACQDLLRRLDQRGLIELPALNRSAVSPRRSPSRTKSSSLFSPLPQAVGPAQVCLREVVVRPLVRSEFPAWREAMERFHYLESARIVGESIRYVAEIRGRWLAFLGWGTASLKSRHREAFVGWDSKTKYQRLHLVANNVRFLILPWVRVPHLASRILSQNLRRLSGDWLARYDHPILLAETFVDLARFRGTCYRAANWIYLGETRGMGRKGDGFVPHGRKKGLLVYPLHRRAREILSAPFPSPEILPMTPMDALSIDINKLPLQGKGSLIEVLSEISDPRSRRGIRHPIASVLALAVMATLCGMRSYEAIAEWAADRRKDLLKELRCWCHRAPSEPTFRRVLQSVDADEIDQKVCRWLARFSSPREPVSLDGKTLRGSKDGENPARHLLGAITHHSGLVVAQEEVGEKSNEIPAAKPLLEGLNLKGRTVTADALHTQRDLARFLVKENGADYVFIAKDNQPTLRQDIEALDWESFFPSGPNCGQGARPDRDSPDPGEC